MPTYEPYPETSLLHRRTFARVIPCLPTELRSNNPLLRRWEALSQELPEIDRCASRRHFGLHPGDATCPGHCGRSVGSLPALAVETHSTEESIQPEAAAKEVAPGAAEEQVLPGAPRSVSAPCLPRSVSRPAPPSSRSAPPRPQTRSAPPPARITSRQGRPTITSAAAVPRVIVVVATIVARLPLQVGVAVPTPDGTPATAGGAGALTRRERSSR